VLKTGIPWQYLPKEMGCGSGMTCWRRLKDWQKAGVWDKIHRIVLRHLRKKDRIDFSRAIVELGLSASRFWGAKTGSNATDRRKLGSKHHVITDGNGIPFAVKVTGANRHGVTQLLPLVGSIPPIAGKVGRPRKRPDCVQGDRAYDSQPHREALRKLGIDSLLAKRRTENGSDLGVFRWVVERTLSWLHQFRRLRVRYERRDDIHEAFLTIGCILICANFI